MIEAKIIADSINPAESRLTSFVCTYPRFIHSEVMTHRVFSRNAASSRAIPVEKMIARILKEPAMPVHWGKNQRGMQAGEELSPTDQGLAKHVWREAMRAAVLSAEHLLSLGVHKQIANRLLEPFAHMTSLITATEWGNFFNLRCHKDAQPEFQSLAYAMLEAYRVNKPVNKDWGEWHIPFGDQYIDEGLAIHERLKICTARAARVSYMSFEGDIDHNKDYGLYETLKSSGHMSPFEHAAKATQEGHFIGNPRWRSNFRGWLQYRKLIPNENREIFNVDDLLASQ